MSPMRLLKPKIVSIVNKLTGRDRPPTLLDYKNADSLRDFHGHAGNFSTGMHKIFSDHEVKLLLIWALVSPSAALAYLIWIKYPEFKWFAVPLLAVSVIQFVGQWGGTYWLLQRFGVVA